MPIIKTTTADNGASVSFHKAINASYNINTGVVSLTVSSWTDAESYNAGSLHVWQWHLVGTAACLSGIESYLLTIDPFIGGTIVADDYTSLDAQKARQWAIVKAARDAKMNSYFTWTGPDSVASKFDSDPLAQARITGAVVLAQLALAQGALYSETWTLYDNTTRVLSATDMIGVGVACGAFVSSLINQGTTLRNQIDAATDATTLNAITWPT